MAEPTPPAGTPPANNPGEGGKPPANNPEPGKTLTQAEIDKIVEDRLARDRASREETLAKELGMSIKDAKAVIAAKKKADEDAKSETEKLTGERDTFKKDLDAANLRIAKMEALLEAGAPPEKIPKLLKRVSGSTTEEIKADIAEMKEDGLIPIANPTPGAVQGAGKPGVPGAGAGDKKKIWTKQEVLDLQSKNPTEYAKHRDEILEQMSQGLIK